MKPYSIALAANQVLDVQVGGEYFLLDSAPQQVKFEFFSSGNMARDTLLENALPGDWARPRDGFAWVKITNGAVAQTVRFYVARGEVGRFRVQGEVSVIDGELARVKAGLCFSGFGSQGAVVGQLGHVQLWNPVANTRRLVVEQFYVTTGGAVQVNVWQHNAALTTVSPYKTNKLMGGAASNAEVRTQANAAAIGASLILQWTFPVNETKTFLTYKKPVVIPPGYGMILQGATANSVIAGGFEWFEEDNV